MHGLDDLGVELENPCLKYCFQGRLYFESFLNQAGFTKVLANDPAAESFALENFHAILFQLFSQPVSDKNKNDMDYFMMQFIRFASMDNLVQQRPQNITHLVGCVKYICRAVILIEAKSIFSYRPEVGHDRLDPPCNLIKFVRRDEPTIFDKLCSVNSICFSVIVSESDVTMSGDKLECAVKKQTVVKLRCLQEMVSSLSRRMSAMISFLVPDAAVNSKHNISVDDEKNRAPGYSVFNTIFETESIKSYIKAKGLHENSSSMAIYMRSAEELQRNLCVLYILTTGSPTRGAEMSRWQTTNTISRQRNMFYDPSKQLLYIKYSDTKTSRARQRDKIYYKFLSKFLTNASVLYFGWIRRVEKFGARMLQMPKVSISAFESSFFVFDGRSSSSNDYSMITRKYCVQFNIPPLGMRDLRQAIIGFSRAWLGDFCRINAVRDYLEQYVACQAAHSVTTHRTSYGGDRPIEDIESFFISSVSFMWLLAVDLPSVGMEMIPDFVKSSGYAGGVKRILQSAINAQSKGYI